VAAVPSGPNWTPPPTVQIKKKVGYKNIYEVIISIVIIIIIMALQPFVGPWSLLQSLDPINSR
jgi:hypothetical protein